MQYLVVVKNLRQLKTRVKTVPRESTQIVQVTDSARCAPPDSTQTAVVAQTIAVTALTETLSLQNLTIRTKRVKDRANIVPWVKTILPSVWYFTGVLTAP